MLKEEKGLTNAINCFFVVFFFDVAVTAVIS